MVGVGVITGDLLFMEWTGFTGLGGTTGGGANLFWGLLILMLSVVLPLAGVVV